MKDQKGKSIAYLDIALHTEKEPLLEAAFLKALVALMEKEFCFLELKHTQECAATSPVLSSSSYFPELEIRLTSRELEILHRLLSGLTNTEIAALLSLSIRTIETHRRNLYRKLGVKSFAEILRRLQRK